ncbi:FecCD family ABC transporter permease [Campylobacter sp. RM16187]|uniref:FecCD family ABC transporter permease n=1 Tax=Campylobacter sp. RM16187 TaxID=1660063 RepID=UPI0021B6CD48|nr:iron ABC transporter permease [Campylobacter sp. RM16187]QKG29958.1 iron ABC transporter, permease protein [Campylobacter sp. RM16187]
MLNLKESVSFFSNNAIAFKLTIISVLPVVVFLFSMTIGHYKLGIYDILNLLFSDKSSYPQIAQTVVFDVRLPRTLLAMMVGCSLAVSGAIYQGIFKNPMASPNILGTSAGAGFGTAMAIVLSFGVVATQAMTFLFGLFAVGLTYAISTKVSKSNNMTLVFVLTGILVSTVFQALISLIKYVADPYEKLPTITFWLMGSLATADMDDIFIITLPFLIGMVPLFLIRWRINILALNDDDIKCLGIDANKIRLIAISCSTLLTASCVSVAGLVGWVGLIVPHIARMLVGPDFRVLLPASALIGATYLLLIDDIARGAFMAEIPLSILTALIGAPYFIYLLLKTQR